MATNKSEFKIHIPSTFDASGVDKAKAAYADLAAQLKLLNADIAQAERTGVSVPQDAKDKVDSLTKAIAGYGKAAETAGVSHRELHEGIRLVALTAGDALGPIGELAHFLANPYLLAASGALLAIKMLSDAHKELHDAMVKNIEASRDQAAIFRTAHVDAFNAAAAAANAFQIRMEHLRDSVDSYALSLARAISVTQQNRTETEGLLDAVEKLQEAYINAARAAGELTPGQASVAIEHAQQALRQRREATEDQQTADEHAARSRAMAQEHHAIGEARGTLPEELADQTSKDEQIKTATALVDAVKSQLPDLQKAAADAQANLPTLSKNVEKTKQYMADAGAEDSPIWKGLLKRDEDKLAAATAAIKAAEQAQDYVTAQEALIASYKEQKQTIDANVARDRDIIAKKTELIATLEREMQEADATAAAHRRYRATLDQITDQTAVLTRLTTLGQRGPQNPEEQGEMHGAGENITAQLLRSLGDRMRAITHETGPQRQQDLELLLGEVMGLIDQLILHPAIRNHDQIMARLRALEDTLANSVSRSNHAAYQ